MRGSPGFIDHLAAEFGAYMRDLRVTRGLTTRNLADILGVSIAQVSAWEQSVRFPADEMIPAITEALRVDEKTFSKKLTRCAHPFAYAAIFGVEKDPDLRAFLVRLKADIPARKADLLRVEALRKAARSRRSMN